MSLGYPPLRPKPDGATVLTQKVGSYGVPDRMLNGLRSDKEEMCARHPLEYSEKHWQENMQQMDMAMLRNLQGVHAPLRLRMERLTAQKVQRLPCLHSSNLMLDTLNGRLDTIDFDDIYSDPEQQEEIQAQPHMFVERQLGLL
ncbi:hypothetical protein NP493_643g04037 [Ridgeia piscesae]|uniref:Proteasome maturation protein n=1 Tax=Ridgeia piscesae TaxID=27915 RepID=A0AAD9KSC6_RIDPI|nr:hypothetical protein NP493_643g04037 [Ridgeia piscesae]